ncbi:MAG: hypothetical protein IIZ25_09860 [Thermoguttaceae bacterium]|nr:hypothetical protein [Thermoguttaceae bacterium]
MTFPPSQSSNDLPSAGTARALRLAALGMALFLGLAAPALGAGGIEIWATTADFELKDLPVLDLLEMRARIDGFTFLLDRRIDPTLAITYSNRSVQLAQGLTEALATIKLEAFFLDRFLYVGPPGSVGTFLLDRALRHEKLAASSNPARGRLKTLISLDGEDGCVPSELLAEAAKKVDFSWEKIRTMPFDCWRPVRIPPIPAEDIFSLLLIGFDVSWRIDDQKPVLCPVSRKAQGEVTVTFERDELAGIDRQAYPDIQWESVIGTLKGTGPFEDLADIEYKIALERMRQVLGAVKDSGTSRPRNQAQNSGGSATPAKRSGNRSGQRGTQQDATRILSGELRQIPLGSVFESFQSQLGLECLLDPSAENAGVTLDTRVTCRFDQADRRKAIKILADALGLSVKIKGNTVLFLKKK